MTEKRSIIRWTYPEGIEIILCQIKKLLKGSKGGMLGKFNEEGLKSHQKTNIFSMKRKKDILRRVCEGGNVVTREIDEVSDGGNTMQDERGRDGVSVHQNQNIMEDMLEGFTLVCPGEHHDES